MHPGPQIASNSKHVDLGLQETPHDLSSSKSHALRSVSTVVGRRKGDRRASASMHVLRRGLARRLWSVGEADCCLLASPPYCSLVLPTLSLLSAPKTHPLFLYACASRPLLSLQYSLGLSLIWSRPIVGLAGCLPQSFQRPNPLTEALVGDAVMR